MIFSIMIQRMGGGGTEGTHAIFCHTPEKTHEIEKFRSIEWREPMYCIAGYGYSRTGAAPLCTHACTLERGVT